MISNDAGVVSDYERWKRCAAALGIDRATLARHFKQPGAPTDPDIDAWRVWLAATAIGGGSDVSPKTDGGLPSQPVDIARVLGAKLPHLRQRDLDVIAASVHDAFVAEGTLLAAAVVAKLQRLSATDRQALEDALAAAWSTALERIARGTGQAEAPPPPDAAKPLP